MNDTLIGRAVSRRTRRAGFSSFAAFYHIAAMNNWQEVVAEQTRVLDGCGLSPVCHVNGTPRDAELVRGRGLDVCSVSPALDDYETPTLQLLWEWCIANRGGAVLYLHTKGVSAPSDASKSWWRRLMMDHTVAPWADNLERLEIADIVGVDWIESPDHPHFSGNIWMARADWISSLPSPLEHRRRGGPPVMGNPWDRWHAEAWCGSNQWHIVESLVCRNENLMSPGSRFFDPYR